MNEKQEEIFALVQSVPCSNINEFEIINEDGYYLVHRSIKEKFNNLQEELEKLEVERKSAGTREGWVGDLLLTIPSHPVRKVSDDGKPKPV